MKAEEAEENVCKAEQKAAEFTEKPRRYEEEFI